MLYWNKLSKKEKIGLSLAILFAAVALLDRLIFDPIEKHLTRVSRDIHVKEKELAGDMRSLQQRNLIENKYSEITAPLLKHGSDEEEVSVILREIEVLARQTSVTLSDMKPQTPKVTELYQLFTIELEAEAEMESLLNFLYQLNTSPQVLRAGKLRLSPQQKDSSQIKASMAITKVLVL